MPIAPPEEPFELRPVPTDRMLTTEQVAAILGISVETLRKWRQRRQFLPYFKYDQDAVRYRLSDVLTFIEESAVN